MLLAELRRSIPRRPPSPTTTKSPSSGTVAPHRTRTIFGWTKSLSWTNERHALSHLPRERTRPRPFLHSILASPARANRARHGVRLRRVWPPMALAGQANAHRLRVHLPSGG